MAETTKTTTSTRGRKPKAKVEETIQSIDTENKNTADMIIQMQKQMEELQKQLLASQKKVDSISQEKTDLQTLVETLKGGVSQNNMLPKKVKVMSLVPNKYNLCTQERGRGRIYTFLEFGDIVTMKTSELEEILSIQKQRKQAEQGYFYILDKDIVADQDLEDVYETINTKEIMEHVFRLDNDDCVEVFCGLDKNLQESVATQIAEMLNSGVKLDRNKIADIAFKTDIDIEEIAKRLSSNR